MTEFLQLLVAFPTIICTVMMGLVLFYWCFVMFGALDIDVIDFGDFGMDGALDGAAEGAGEAAAEAVAEAAGEAAAEAAAEAFAEAAGEAAAEAAGEAAAEAAGEAAAEAGTSGLSGMLIGVFTALNLHKVPITVSASILTFYGWFLTVLGMIYLPPLELASQMVTGGLVMAGAFGVSLIATSVTVRPLAPIFVTHIHRGQETLVGKTVIIQTQTVTARHGQARYNKNGTELNLSIRCERDTKMTKGSKALIIDYDKKTNTYLVEPLDELL